MSTAASQKRLSLTSAVSGGGAKEFPDVNLVCQNAYLI